MTAAYFSNWRGLLNRGEDIGVRHAASLALLSHGMEPNFVLTPLLYRICRYCIESVDNPVHNLFTGCE